MRNKSSFLGIVEDVSGTSVSVSLASETLSGLVFVNGQGYKIGQVGSFVRIPIGYIDLFGVVSQVGASAVPENLILKEFQKEVEKKLDRGYRWLKVQLIGEGQNGGNFKRGISQYPTIGDEVHLVSQDDLRKIYGEVDMPYFVQIGHVAGAEGIPAFIDVNKLITRHSAVVGSTGSGKSTTVASLLVSLSNTEVYPSSRIIIIDIHGEYGRALADRAHIFKVNPESNSKNKDRSLFIPYWAMTSEELLEIAFGAFADDGKDREYVLEKIIEFKQHSHKKQNREGVTEDNLNADTPIPFSIHKLWYELYCEMFATYYSGGDKRPEKANWAHEKDSADRLLIGDVMKGIPPKFRSVKDVRGDTEKINYIPNTHNFRRQVENLGSKLRLRRYDFLFRPGSWLPNEEGETKEDLDSLIKQWIGDDKPISILDLSGVPNSILNNIISALLRILYDGLFWARNLSQGGRYRPLLVVMEEAHSYLSDKSNGHAMEAVQRIVREGRKYGLGVMIVSQRPSEVNATILSQCGTFFAMRLTNQSDRSHVSSVVPDNLESLTNMLPILRTGEAIILGEAVKLPMRTIIEPPRKDRRPDSEDPIVYDVVKPEDSMHPGGWGIMMETNPNYKEFVKVWRQQNARVTIDKTKGGKDGDGSS
jgi:hypothetical protein